MSLHDPLCPAASRCPSCGCKRCECVLIATVRADQAKTSYREGYNAHATAAATGYQMFGLPKGYAAQAADNRP